MSKDNLDDSFAYEDSYYVSGDEERDEDVRKHSVDDYVYDDDDDDVPVYGEEESYYGWHDEDDESKDKAKARVKATTSPQKINEDARQVDKSTSALLTEPDSYASLPTTADMEPEAPVHRFSESLGIPGVARINLSPLTQKIIGCVIDENVTTEYPWVYVRKEIIEDNLDLHPASSDFIPVKDEIESLEAAEILVGYAPTLREVGQFYICLTEESRRDVEQRVEEQRREQQERVRNAVYKTPAAWKHLGSGDFVDQTIVKNTRPLFEIEVKSSVGQLKARTELSDRASADQRDGYVELLPYRETFSNVERMLVDRGSKAVPRIKTSDAQTETRMQVNVSNQCALDQEPSAENAHTGKKAEKELEKFVKSKLEDVCKEIHGNTTWDVYANDYAKLGEATPTTLAKITEASSSSGNRYIERQIYYEGNLCRGRVINDLSWHPQWAGVAAAVYTPTGKSETLVGRKPPDKVFTGDEQVLVWSFDDCLKPKLILEAKRLVTSVSFCPRNGNIVIGGCKNGQIVIWDISGKIEEVERIVVRTTAQVKHHALVKSLTTWMKEARDSSVVRPSATSNLQHSQKDAITKIEWLSPYRRISNRGAVQDLPADAEEDELGNQFVTSSEDGSVAFWDLSLKEAEEKKKDEAKSKRKKRRSIQKPQALKESISPYKLLDDDTYKPIFMIIVTDPVTVRNSSVTAISLRYPNFKKLPAEAIPRSSDYTAERRQYSVLVEKDEEASPTNGLFVATAAGECGVVSWEGFDFSTGISVNKEVSKWTWRRQLHDGPVSHAVRSRHLRDLVLTVGGKIFALWREDFDEPVLWRKSKFRYTGCCWDAERPSVMLLGRNDGTVEIWDLSVKSHLPSATQSLSGRTITGIFAHELPLSPQCVGFCDYNGALRIFLAPAVTASEIERFQAVDWMREFVDREVTRIKDFQAWHKKWMKMTKVETGEQEADDDKKEAAIAEDTIKGEMTEEAAKLDASRKAKAKKRTELIEKLQSRWVTRELERMQRAILTKKGLREEELERRQEPVLQMKREAEAKEARRRRVIERAPELFEDALASNFPHHKEKLLTAFTLASSTAAADATMAARLSVLTTDQASGDHKTEDEEIIEEYERIESEALRAIQNRSQNMDLEFSWRKLIEDGIKRRKSLDVKLKSHRMRFKEFESSSSLVMTDDNISSIPELEEEEEEEGVEDQNAGDESSRQ